MDAYHLAEVFFSDIVQSDEIIEHCKRFDEDVQFTFRDDEPFYVEIRSGSFGVRKGMSSKDYYGKIDILTDSDTFKRLVNGATTLAEAIEDMKLEARDMIRRSVVGWFGKMIRLGQEYRIRNMMLGRTQ